MADAGTRSPPTKAKARPRAKPGSRRRAYAGPVCPHCAAVLGELKDGYAVCRGCGLEFTATVFAPVEEPGPAVLPSGAGTPCARHARNLAMASCSRCGAFMCELCRIDAEEQQLCAACFERLEGEGALPGLRRTVRNWNGMAFHMGILAFLFSFMFLGVIAGPIAMWYAVKGLRQNRDTGERISVAAGWIGLGLGLVAALISTLMGVALLGVFK